MGKTRLCERWLLGKCRRAEDCTFAHGDEELAFWQSTVQQSRKRRTPLQTISHVPQAIDQPAEKCQCELKPSLLEMLPSQIGFCHDTVAHCFRNGEPIIHTLFDLIHGKVLLHDVPQMQVVLHREAFYSLSNRRLCLHRLCEHVGLISKYTPVKVELLCHYPKGFDRKLTTICNGDWVRVRNDGRLCTRSLVTTTFGRQELFGAAG